MGAIHDNFGNVRYEIRSPYGELDMEVITPMPLNVKDVVASRMRGPSRFDDEAVARIIRAAAILYEGTAESEGIWECLWTAMTAESEAG